MCAPRVTWHTLIRYTSSCDAQVKMGVSIVFTAAMIRAFRHHHGSSRITLTRVSQELEYRINVCRVTHGAHIKVL
jgi:hypothetical protein